MLKVFEVFETLGRGESLWSPYKILRVRWILFDRQLKMLYKSLEHWYIIFSRLLQSRSCQHTATQCPHPSTDTIQDTHGENRPGHYENSLSVPTNLVSH
jgi:hypothetical protein